MDPRSTQPYRQHLPQAEGPEKTILVVEDERTTLNLLRTGLKGLAGYVVLTAENGLQAVEILKLESVDVLVTDLHMPVMDGFQLIATVSRLYPSLPILVLTGLPEAQHQNRPLHLGALRIFAKPVRLSTLMEEVKAAVHREPEGLVKGLSLASLLQLLEWERKTCTLTVRSSHRTGLLYLKEGQVIHAGYHDQEGLPAAYEILCWDGPEVEFVGTCRVESTIDLPTTELLMNTAMIRDNLHRGASPRPDPFSPEGHRSSGA